MKVVSFDASQDLRHDAVFHVVFAWQLAGHHPRQTVVSDRWMADRLQWRLGCIGENHDVDTPLCRNAKRYIAISEHYTSPALSEDHGTRHVKGGGTFVRGRLATELSRSAQFVASIIIIIIIIIIINNVIIYLHESKQHADKSKNNISAWAGQSDTKLR